MAPEPVLSGVLAVAQAGESLWPGLVAAVMVLALVVYVATGGADFGGGVWDLLASGPRKAAQRRAVARALAPVWEANHVWLIVVVVLLFVCFPTGFAALSTALHIPLTLMLIGIVLRGAAFVFRAYDPVNTDETRGPWRLVFAIASAVTPVMLGICLGALATDSLPLDPATGLVQTDFVSAWAAPFPLAVGLLTLVLCAFLAAVYLAAEAASAGKEALHEDFRRRALATGLVLAPVAFGTLALASREAPRLTESLIHGPLALPVHLLAAAAALGALLALWRRRWRLAQVLAIAQSSAVVAGFGLAQWPLLVGPDLSFPGTAAPDHVLRAVLGVLGLGAIPLVPAFWWLYAVFKGEAREREAGEAEAGPR